MFLRGQSYKTDITKSLQSYDFCVTGLIFFVGEVVTLVTLSRCHMGVTHVTRDRCDRGRMGYDGYDGYDGYYG